MPYRVSLNNEPLVVVELCGTLSDCELTAMNAEVTLAMRHHARAGIKTAVILDCTDAGAISSSQRKRIGEWRKEVRDLTSQVCIGMAMVVRNPAIRAILTAISWFQKEPIPVAFLDTFAEGVKWAIDRCDEDNLHVPSHVRIRLQAGAAEKLR